MTTVIPVEQVILLHRDYVAAGPLLHRDKLEAAVASPFAGVSDQEFYPTVTQKAVKLVDAYPQQIERADKLAWRMKVQNPLNQSADTKARGLLWMDPKVWDDTMAFYKEYDQIKSVAPAAEMMTNAFNPGIKAN